METLLPRDAEAATHAAARLTGDAEGAAVGIGDEDGLDELLRVVGLPEEVLLGAVARDLAVHRLTPPDAADFGQTAAGFEGEVGHCVDGVDVLIVQPVAHLFCGKARQTFGSAELLQLVQAHA